MCKDDRACGCHNQYFFLQMKTTKSVVKHYAVRKVELWLYALCRLKKKKYAMRKMWGVEGRGSAVNM